MELNEEQLVKMFNAGYQIQQHEPELLEKILKSANKDSEYIKTLSTGKKQFEREKIAHELQRIKEKKQQRKPKR